MICLFDTFGGLYRKEAYLKIFPFDITKPSEIVFNYTVTKSLFSVLSSGQTLSTFHSTKIERSRAKSSIVEHCREEGGQMLSTFTRLLLDNSFDRFCSSLFFIFFQIFSTAHAQALNCRVESRAPGQTLSTTLDKSSNNRNVERLRSTILI